MYLQTLLQQKRKAYRVAIRRQNIKALMLKQRKEFLRLIIDKSEISSQSSEQMLERVIGSIDLGSIPRQSLSKYDILAIIPQVRFLIDSPTDQEKANLCLQLINDALFFRPELCSQQLILFLQDFVDANNYISMLAFPEFQSNFLSLLQKITERDDIEQQLAALRHRLLTWCRGEKSLHVINNCIRCFLGLDEYQHVYKMIGHLIRKGKEGSCQTALLTLINLLSYAEMDDVFGIHEAYPQIYIELLKKAFQTKDSLSPLHLEAILKLLQTYDQAVLGCVRLGLGELISKHILSPNPDLNTSGLKLLDQVAGIRSRPIALHLLNKNTMPMWAVLTTWCESNSNSTAVLVYSILQKMFFSCNQEDLTCLLEAIEERAGVFVIIKHGLVYYRDQQEIVLKILSMISIILVDYTGGELATIFLEQIRYQGILQLVEEYFHHASVLISQTAGGILTSVERQNNGRTY